MATDPEPRPIRIFNFGRFELSEPEAEVRKNGVRLKLQEQPYRVLLHLVTNPGRVVTREELQQKLWPADTFVDFDVGLNTAVRKLRQTLGDDADEPRYIETIARRGYRFVAPVSESASISASQASPAPLLTFAPKPAEHPAPPVRRTKLHVALVGAAATLLLVGVVAVRYHPVAVPHVATLAIEKRVTWNPEEAPIIGAVVSPDGKYVAYADSTGAFFRAIDTGETRALPVPKGKDWVPTSWYPDSTHLLLSSWGAPSSGPETFAPDVSPSIWRVSILGGSPQKLAEEANEGSISPDGSQVAYLRGGALFDPRQIWLANIAGGNSAQVLASILPKIITSQIAWSPHGERIAYIRVERPELPSNIWAIETLDIKTRVTKLLKVLTRSASGLCWGPDGRLFYGEGKAGAGSRDVFGIFAIPVDEKTGDATGREVEITEGTGRIGEASITSDGKRLVLRREHTAPASYVTEIDMVTGKFKPLRRLTLDQSTNLVTTWTPDSRSIVFASDRSGIFKLYRQAIDQNVPEPLSDGKGLFARLAPDGKNFLYFLDNGIDAPSGRTSVMKIPVEGGSSNTLFELPNVADIQCARSPATLCLLLTSEQEVFSFDFTGGKPRQYPLPAVPGFDQWSLSPDGSTLALTHKGSGLSFIDLASKAVHYFEVTEWPQLLAVDWAPDSKSVYIVSRTPTGKYVFCE